MWRALISRTRSSATRPTWVEIAPAIYRSDLCRSFRESLKDKFYVIKPTTLALPSLSLQNMGNLLAEQRDRVLGWIASHSSNAEAVARYQAELELLNATLTELGLLETVTDPATGQTVTLVRKELDALFLDLPDIYSAPGSIFIEADAAGQSGITTLVNNQQLMARPEARIDIRNETPVLHDGTRCGDSRQPAGHRDRRRIYAAGLRPRVLQQRGDDGCSKSTGQDDQHGPEPPRGGASTISRTSPYPRSTRTCS